jgi:hypothetical protein
MNSVRLLFVSSSLAVALMPRANAANLITNPNFDDGLTGWTSQVIAGDSFTIDATDGSPAAPSAHAIAANVYSIFADCVQITPQNVDLLADVKIQGIGTTVVGAASYSATDCGEATYLTENDLQWAATDTSWTEKSILSFALPAGTNSVHVFLKVFTQAQADVHFDSIRFGPAGSTPVSLQAFEID